MPTSTSPRSVNARFTGDPTNPSELVNALRQSVNNAKKSPDWATEPVVQAAINALSADADALEKTTLRLDELRKETAHVEQEQAQLLVDCTQHKKHAEAAITVASKGSVASVKAWGCVVAERTQSTPTDEAPRNFTATNGRRPGDAVARCRGMRARAFVFQQSDRPTFPEGSPAPVIQSSSVYNVTGLSPGQTIYFRAAVIRPVVGQSKWTEPVQLTVR